VKRSAGLRLLVAMADLPETSVTPTKGVAVPATKTKQG